MSYYGYNRDAYGEYIAHKGKKGSKWGYTKGKKNGKRTAKGDKWELIDDKTGYKDDYEIGDSRKIGNKNYVLKETSNGEDIYIHTNRDGSVSEIRYKKGKGFFDKKTKSILTVDSSYISDAGSGSSKSKHEWETVQEGSLSRGKRALKNKVNEAVKKAKAAKKAEKSKAKPKEQVPKSYKYGGKQYALSSVEDNGAHYKKGNHTVVVSQHGISKTRNMGTYRQGKKAITYIAEGKDAQRKRKIEKVTKSINKTTKKISKSAKVTSKEVKAKAEKGKKKVLKWLEKKKLYTSKASVSNKIVTTSTKKKKKK